MESTELSILVSFFMVLPVIYTNVLAGIRETNQDMLEMARVFKIRWYNRVRFFYVPAVVPYLLSAASVAIGLAWKSGIAAEVICTPKYSIGLNLNSAKVYLESEELYAWTIVVVVMSVLIEKGVIRLLDLLVKSGGLKNVKTLED
jgi:NitT/TauT family transport system permease protein